MFVFTGASISVFAKLSQPIILSPSANKKVLFVALLSSTNKVFVGYDTREDIDQVF